MPNRITYAESKGYPSFDWNNALKAAKLGAVNEYEKWKMKELAREWVTCACGNQCSILERSSSGAPLDQELLDLGVIFYHHVDEHKWDDAIRTLERIETRSECCIMEKIRELEKARQEYEKGLQTP